jgi:hypothetical protein
MAANSWFSARLLFVCEIEGDPERDRLCEVSVIVLQGTNEEEAKQTARQIGLAMQHGYPNEQGEWVQWNLLSILEVQDLSTEQIEQGTEVYSRLFSESQVTDPEIQQVLKKPTSTHS